MRAVRARVFAIALAASRTLWAQTAPPSSSPANATPTDEDAPVEVRVRGAKQTSDIGAQETPAKALRDIPGTFGDPFQAIASQPGVVPMASGVPYFYVRGAPPADTGYFLDGIPLPTLFHLGPGPSVVPPALLENVEFFPGSAPARFGRFAGGIISGETTAPSSVARGEASVRLFDASAFVETPLDAASTVFVGGRYGYPNLLLSLFAPSLSLSYDDYSVRLTRKLSDTDAISIFAIGSYDNENDASQGLVPIDTLFHRLDLRYDHAWTGGSFRWGTTFGYDRTSTPLFTGTNQTVAETSARLRFELRQQLGTALRVRAGADVNAWLDRTVGEGSTTQQVAGAYVDASYRPTDRVELVAGGRVDAYRSPGGITPAVDPRLALRIRMTSWLTSVTTLGIAHQPPSSLLPVPGLRLDPADGLQTAYQYAEGAEVRLPWAVLAKVTGFYNADRNMNDFVSDCGTFLASCGLVARASGATYGLEVNLLRAFSQKFAGWISYTLSRAERQVGGVSLLSLFDRTHVLSAVSRYDFGNGIDVGVRGAYNTGRPDIPTLTVDGQPLAYALGTAAFAQHRLPSFYRIDLRAEKRWSLGGRKWIAAVAEFFDATLNSEAVEFQCAVETGVCRARRVGPIALPSIGIDGGF